jgi:hypothetical protein
MQTARSEGAELVPFTPAKAYEIAEAVMMRGDLSRLTHEERVKYCSRLCESIGLNPMTQPFKYIELNGKLKLYALKDCTDQLRRLHGVSVTDLSESERDGVFIVTAKVANADGRTDAAKGAVNIANLKGDVLANALMKAETKAKRRATLSICGLGFLDETEVEDIPATSKRDVPEITKPVSQNAISDSPVQTRENYSNSIPDRKTSVRTVVPAPKHSLKEGGLADRAMIQRVAAAHAQKDRSQPFVVSGPFPPVDEAAKALNRQLHPMNDELPGDLAPPKEQPRDRESHRALMKASLEPFDHTDDGGIPASLRRKPAPKQADLDIRDEPTPKPDNVIDPHVWYGEVDDAISRCTDLAAIGRVQVMQMMPVKKRIPAEIWRLAEGLIGKRMTQLGEQLIAAE